MKVAGKMTRQTTHDEVAPAVRSATKEFASIFNGWGLGRTAVSVGGSYGKGMWDSLSDVDLRLFHEVDLPWPDHDPDRWQPYFELVRIWKDRGVVVDNVWPRKIEDVEASLNEWIEGTGTPESVVWSVWGYHLPTDIQNQWVITDPSGLLAEWRDRLTPYPPKLKRSLLNEHMGSLRYWRRDYHYSSKVARMDVCFLASVAARLVHDIMQVIFALNETYYPGDGANLTIAERFELKPPGLSQRITEVLYPEKGVAIYERQHETLRNLIDEIEELVEQYAGQP